MPVGSFRIANGEDAHQRRSVTADGDLLTAPPGTLECALSVEDAPIRITFNDQDPREAGLYIRRGQLITFPILEGESFRFAAADDGSDAQVSLVWMRDREESAAV
jgi:hypothetical protein